jgi:UDP-N-acetyl-D-mannosaminuronate dehydrogenase
LRQLVVGAGEVGRALAEVLGCDLRDVEPFEGHYDVLHIAFGYTDDFVDQVMAYEWQHRAEIVVVHSTVRPGTCSAHGWCYSPVTGQHPDLVESLRTFVKPIAGPAEDVLAVFRLFHEAGLTVVPVRRTTDLEAAKLVDLLVYGANIRLAKEVERYCREQGLDFREVFTVSAVRYNMGYEALDDTPRRYVLTHQPGPIGGHCVGYPNLGLLGDERLEALVRPATKEHWDDLLD